MSQLFGCKRQRTTIHAGHHHGEAADAASCHRVRCHVVERALEDELAEVGGKRVRHDQPLEAPHYDVVDARRRLIRGVIARGRLQLQQVHAGLCDDSFVATFAG